MAFFLPRFELHHWVGEQVRREVVMATGFSRSEGKLTPLGPFLVHDSMSALSTTDRLTGSNLVPRATVCFEERITTVQKKREGGWHLHRGTPFRVSGPCKERRQAGNWPRVVVDS